MRLQSSTAPVPLRVSGLVALFIALAWLLAGCSSSDESADSSYGADSAAYLEDNTFQATVASEDMASGDMASEAMPLDGGPAPAADRSIIVTGSMYMTVDDPIAAADEAVRIVLDAGGRIDARNEVAARDYEGGSAWLTMRIPSTGIDPVVEELRALGTVDEYSTQSTDVTIQVSDLEAQISTLSDSTERIQELLLEAEDIADIIKLENELASRQAQLESLEAQQRGLNDQVSMSTIDLSLTTEPVVIVDDDPTNFWDGLVAGWNALLGFLSGSLVVLGVLLPWLVLLGIVALVVILVTRALVSRKGRADAGDSKAPPSGLREEGRSTTLD